ncbi:katanin, putative, partial [Bodo saltans]
MPTPSRAPVGGGAGGRLIKRGGEASPTGVPPPWSNNGGGAYYSDDQQQPVMMLEDPDSRPLPRPSDLLVGWEEILSGGRVQRQTRDNSHLLLVTEEPYSCMVQSFLRSDVVAIRGEGPLSPSSSSSSPTAVAQSSSSSPSVAQNHVPVDAAASVSAQVQNLGSRGRYVCCIVGVTLGPGEEAGPAGFTGASVHFDPSGSVFVSVDQWRVNSNTDGVDKVAVLQSAVPVRMLRDRINVHVRVRSSWPNHMLDVFVQNEVLFSGVPLPMASGGGGGGGGGGSGGDYNNNGGDSADCPLDRVRPIFCSSGGRVSLKNIVLGDAPPPPATTTTSVPPPPPPAAVVDANRPATKSQPRKTTASPAPAPRASSVRGGGGGTNPQALPQRHASEGRLGGKGASPAQGISVTGVDPELVQRIEDEILDASPNVAWEDISGMGDAKRLLNEAVVLPLLVPELFTGVLQPWKGVLLFGPPGTGKTMLAKAVAASAKTTFFNMSASTLIQKHFGESEKMVRALFEVARARSPSTIFFDEVDALMSSRGSNSEHEAMRRVKTELLRQMDGLHGSDHEGSARVMVLATTNRPWDLDEAMRRRLEKRIYVPLPDLNGRLDILRSNTKKMQLDPSLRLEPVARRTDGFSGADLHLLCRNAGMMPMRRLVEGKTPEQLAGMKQRGEIVLGSVTED